MDKEKSKEKCTMETNLDKIKKTLELERIKITNIKNNVIQINHNPNDSGLLYAFLDDGHQATSEPGKLIISEDSHTFIIKQ